LKSYRFLRGLFSADSVNKVLLVFGYKLTPVGESYAYSARKVKKLEKKGVDINYVIESGAKYEEGIGQRDRICERILANISKQEINQVLEIGPGTGRFTSKIISTLKPANYIVFETNKSWRKYLLEKFGNSESMNFFAPTPTGHNFGSVESDSIDFIHGHGVLVYLNHVTTYSYLKEMIRVAAPGAIIYLEYFSIENCNSEILSYWHKSVHWFPIFQSDRIIDKILTESGFSLIDEWGEMFGQSFTRNVMFQKKG
jgi:phospholipid N-methyltransferase